MDQRLSGAWEGDTRSGEGEVVTVPCPSGLKLGERGQGEKDHTEGAAPWPPADGRTAARPGSLPLERTFVLLLVCGALFLHFLFLLALAVHVLVHLLLVSGVGRGQETSGDPAQQGGTASPSPRLSRGAAHSLYTRPKPPRGRHRCSHRSPQHGPTRGPNGHFRNN